jgi:outer membrane immunogenic protein
MRRVVAVLSLSAVIGLSASSFASAADKAPATVAAYNWTGLYVGGNVGYGWGGNTGSQWDSFADPPPFPIFGAALYFAAGGNVLPGVKPDGIIGGGQIGYDWQISPQWVLGVVADFQASDMHGSASASVTPPPGFANTVQRNRAKIEWFGTVRGRVGYAANNWLIYGTGGLIYGKVKSDVALDCAACGPPLFYAGQTSSTKTGWTAGGGIDFGLTPNWSIGAEYLYFDLGNVSTTAVLTSGAVTRATFTANSEFTGHIVRTTVNYRFAAH